MGFRSEALRVLYLEADPAAVARTRAVLAEAGLAVDLEAVADPDAFRTAVGRSEYALLLCAFTAPGDEAFDALRFAREARPGIPCVFVSDTPGEEHAVLALQRGATDYVLKARLARLAAAVRRALAEVTRPHEAEEALRQRAEELSTIMEVAPVAIWVSRDVRCERIFGNETANRFYEAGVGENVSAGPAPGEPVAPRRFFIGGRELAAAELPMQRAAAEGRLVRDVEFEVIVPSGARKVLFGSARPLRGPGDEVRGCVGAFVDITDRKSAEEALRAALAESDARRRLLDESEARFRQLADAMPQLVWAAAPDGRVDYYNERAGEFSGIVQRPDGTWNWDPVVHPDDRERTIQAWTHALATGETYEVSHRVKRADHSYGWYLSRGVPVRDEDGRIARWYGTATDIDAQKRAEDALLEGDRRKDEFLALLSHELRNPLAPIANSLFLLERAAPGSAQAKRAEEIIRRQVAHLTRLVDDLLDVTRITRGKIRLQRERLDLRDVVHRTADDHRGVFDTNDVVLEVRFGAEPVPVDGDPTRLAQVVGNLVGNAAKFTPPGGRVQLFVGAEGADGLVRVRDTGPGIAPEMMGRLFQPFMQAEQTLDRSKGGLGLGLALVKGLVELHGGTVTVVGKAPDGGAEFTVRVPLAPGAAPSPAPPSLAEGRGPKRVLVIEDNPDAAESLKDALETIGHEVQLASTGLAGVERAREYRPDVVICDIGLPGVDGYEVARRLRTDPRLGSTMLVALSGYARPEDLARSREAGFARHLAKPPDLGELERLLADASP